MNISLNPDVDFDFKRFQKEFGFAFNHIHENDRKNVMRVEFERLMKGRPKRKTVQKADDKEEGAE